MKILLACEFGIGLRHIGRLLKLAQHYLNEGHSVSICHHDPTLLKFVFQHIPPSLSLFSTPVGESLKQTRLGSYADILSCLGCDDKALFSLRLNSWKCLLKLIEPDLIICENAPVLSLVGRSYAPLICMGDGYSILPFAKDKFPLLRPDTCPKIKPNILLENMNEVLKQMGITSLEKFGDIWQGHPLFINHISDLDMYLPHRQQAIHAPFYDLWVESDPIEEDMFFAYLSSEYPNVDSILISLVQNKMRGVIYMPDATQKIVDYLKQHKITVHKFLEKPLAHYLRRKNFVLHHGGMELTQAAMAKGIPQIFFPIGIHNFFLANILKCRRCGDIIDAHRLGLNQVSELIKSLVYESNFRQWSQMEGLKLKESKPESTSFQMILNCVHQTLKSQAA